MTEDEKYEIAVLAETAHEKWQAFMGTQMMQASPEAAIASALAQTEWMEANSALRKAQTRISSK